MIMVKDGKSITLVDDGRRQNMIKPWSEGQLSYCDDRGDSIEMEMPVQMIKKAFLRFDLCRKPGLVRDLHILFRCHGGNK